MLFMCLQPGSACFAQSKESDSTLLREITWRDRLLWSMQLAFNPGELASVVPVFIYNIEQDAPDSEILNDLRLPVYLVKETKLEGEPIRLCLYYHSKTSEQENERRVSCLKEQDDSIRVAMNHPIENMEAGEKNYWVHTDSLYSREMGLEQSKSKSETHEVAALGAENEVEAGKVYENESGIEPDDDAEFPHWADGESPSLQSD